MKDDEKVASERLRSFFRNQDWTVAAEVTTTTGGRIDYVVKALVDGEILSFGVECKPNLNEDTKLTTWADYLEQAAAYSRDLSMPVFVGPYITADSMSGLQQGGANVKAVSAFCSFGGRQNVGLLVACVRYNGSRWFMSLRGAYFWELRNGFNAKRLNVVKSTGSKKIRMPIFKGVLNDARG